MKTAKINIKEEAGQTYWFAHIYDKGFWFASLFAFSEKSMKEQLKRIYGIDMEEHRFNDELQNILKGLDLQVMAN